MVSGGHSPGCARARVRVWRLAPALVTPSRTAPGVLLQTAMRLQVQETLPSGQHSADHLAMHVGEPAVAAVVQDQAHSSAAVQRVTLLLFPVAASARPSGRQATQVTGPSCP